LATILTPLLAVICLLGVIFTPAIVDFMFPGFAEVAGKRELTIHLARIMFPFLLFIALAAKAMGVLNAKGRFGLPAMASALFNVVSVISGLAIGFWLGPKLGFEPIVGMAIGTLLGGVAQYACQLPELRKAGLRYRPDFTFADEGIRQVLRLMGPAVIGAAAVQVNVVVNSNFASQIMSDAGEVINGPVSWLGYAFRFMQLPLGLFGVALASATLPSISQSAGAGRIAEFRETLSRSLGLVFLLTIPSAVGLIVLSRSIVGVLFQGGEFTAHDTEQTAIALSYYCIGLAAYAAIKVLTPAYYALNALRVPVAASVLSIAINYTLNWVFVRVLGWGHGGLAFSTSAVAIFNFLLLFWFMRRKIQGVYGNRLLFGVTKIIVASALMGAACMASSSAVGHAFGQSGMARLLDLSVSVPLGLGVLYGACRWMGIHEFEAAQQALLERLRGKPGQPPNEPPLGYDKIDRNGY
jgi:putative peptidoglycan lipid II flippase